MKRVSLLLILAGASAGWWLPSLWLEAPVSETAPRIAPPAVARPAAPSLEKQVQQAGSAMAKLQAVVAGILPRQALMEGETPDLGFDEAEELALALAGESLAAGVQNGVDFITSLRQSKVDYRVREAAEEAWAEAHPDEALEVLMHSAMEPDGIFDGALRKAAERDPERALALLKTAPDSTSGTRVWQTITAALAVKAPQTALEVAKAAPDKSRRLLCMNALTETMAEANPQQALAWRESLPEELKEICPLSTIYQKWRQKDPEAAMAAAEKLPPVRGETNDDFQETYDMSKVLAQGWINQDAAAWYEWASKRGEIPGELLLQAARNISAGDPVKALAIYRTVKGEKQNAAHSTLRQIATEWSRHDPAAALAWVRTLPQDQRPALLGGMDFAIRTLPDEERLALAEETGTGTPQGFQLLYEVDRQKALAALAAAPAETKWKQFDGVWQTLLNTDPAAAASLFQTVMEQPVPEFAKNSESQAAEITARWAGSDPAAAAAWAAQLPPGEAGTAAVQNAVGTWARFDYPAASAWAAAQPPGPVRDEAVKTLDSLVENQK